MHDKDWLAERFQEQRPHLRGVAYRMLGSISEADDAVQEAWLRLSRSDTSSVENLGGWLTTVVARVCAEHAAVAEAKREESLDGRLPDPIVSPDDSGNPEQEALMADSVGLALLVVLETLAPAERLAFVLHDMFAVPFDEIATITERSPAAARQLASRARRRVQGQRRLPTPTGSSAPVVDAFIAAAQERRLRRARGGAGPGRRAAGRRRTGPDGAFVIRGARAVAERASSFAHVAPFAQHALVNGAIGAVVAPRAARSRSWPSRWRTARSSRSTSSPIPSA